MHPQRTYDIVTILIGIGILTLYEYAVPISLKITLPGLLLSIGLGGALPCMIWLINGKKLKLGLSRAITIDSIVFLPLCAIFEEVIWRLLFPYYLISVTGMDYLVAISIASLLFILLHWPIGGVKNIPYISTFTLIIVVIYLNFGFLAGALFHLFHNMAMVFVRPISSMPTVKERVVCESEDDW